MKTFYIRSLYFKIDVNILDEFYEEELRRAVRRGLNKWVTDTGIWKRTNKQKKASDKKDLQDYLNKYAVKESHANAVEVKVRVYPIRTISLAILDLGSARNPHVLRVRSGFSALSVSKLAAPITPTGIGS